MESVEDRYVAVQLLFVLIKRKSNALTMTDGGVPFPLGRLGVKNEVYLSHPGKKHSLNGRFFFQHGKIKQITVQYQYEI